MSEDLSAVEDKILCPHCHFICSDNETIETCAEHDVWACINCKRSFRIYQIDMVKKITTRTEVDCLLDSIMVNDIYTRSHTLSMVKRDAYCAEQAALKDRLVATLIAERNG